MKSNKVKGSIFIFLGASCYGMLGVYVKMAYHSGYTTGEVTLSQFMIGFIVLLFLNVFRSSNYGKDNIKVPIKSKLHLMIAGTSLGLTSIFYYLAVSYIPVSVCIVLLMQMVWLGVLLETVIKRKLPERRKVFAALIVIIGSIFATRLFQQSITLNSKGIIMGIMAAICYTATIYSTKNIKVEYSPYQRSLYMILGGLIIISLVFHSSLNLNFNYRIFISWGLIISLFGTVLPPLLFTAGMPLTGIGLGGILASVEIPVAVLASALLLNEDVNTSQWVGVVLILLAVGLMNFPTKKLNKT